MADRCEMCAHYVVDEEFGDYCSIAVGGTCGCTAAVSVSSGAYYDLV